MHAHMKNAVCAVHAVNDGLRISGDSVIVEWQGTGPSVEGFLCQLREVDTIPRPCMCIIETCTALYTHNCYILLHTTHTHRYFTLLT